MYQLVVTKTFGSTVVIERGHNPTTVRAAEARVSRNARVIDRIELHDHEGPLECIWSRNWFQTCED